MDKEKLKKELIHLVKEKSLITDVERVLTSGRVSNYYIDAKMTTLDPKGANLTARLFLEVLKSYDINAIGGYTLGADPIVSAVAALSAETERPLPAFIVRKEPKKHGERKMIEGPFERGWRVAGVGEVATTGGAPPGMGKGRVGEKGGTRGGPPPTKKKRNERMGGGGSMW